MVKGGEFNLRIPGNEKAKEVKTALSERGHAMLKGILSKESYNVTGLAVYIM
jgi:hypothetical protein